MKYEGSGSALFAYVPLLGFPNNNGLKSCITLVLTNLHKQSFSACITVFRGYPRMEEEPGLDRKGTGTAKNGTGYSCPTDKVEREKMSFTATFLS